MTMDSPATLNQKASEARKAAKALQRKLREMTDPEERKQISRQMNELFAEAKSLRNEASQARSVERDFVNMTDDF